MGIDPLRASSSSRWHYWKTPVLFGVGFCVLQILVALVRFGSMDSWNPEELLFAIPALFSGLVLFFLGGVLVGLLAQRLLRGVVGAWRSVFTDHARGGDSACCTVQPCRRIARPTYGAYRRSRSVSAPGRNPAVDPAGLAASPKSASTEGVILPASENRTFTESLKGTASVPAPPDIEWPSSVHPSPTRVRYCAR